MTAKKTTLLMGLAVVIAGGLAANWAMRRGDSALTGNAVGDPVNAVVASADTYVQRNDSGPYGAAPVIVVKRDSLNTTRKGMLRFANVPSGNFADASLSLDVEGANGDATFYAWGIKDASPTACQENFNASTILYSQVSFLDDSGDGVWNDNPCLHDSNADAGGAQSLGTFTITPADVSHTVTLRSPALTNFLNANTNGTVSIVLTRIEQDGALNTNFASREHPTLNPPTLSWVEADGVAFEGGAPAQQADGSTTFVGTLKLPIAGGAFIALPNADVRMTFNAAGKLQTMSGSVGFPALPDMGVWGSLGDIAATTPSLQIGYDIAGNFDDFGLPLDSNTRYFYLSASSAASIGWGPFEYGAPGAAGLLLAIDPTTPSVLIHADQDGTFLPLSSSASFGISATNSFPFKAQMKDGVESHMDDFAGDFFLDGEVSLPLDIEAIDVVASGGMTFDTIDGPFSLGTPQDWIQNCGANGGMRADFSVGPMSGSFDFGEASMVYRRGTSPASSFAFSAKIIPDDHVTGLPFTVKVDSNGTAAAWGLISADSNLSFVEVQGEYTFGPSFEKQKIEGFIHADYSGASFNGHARFAGTVMDVEGEIGSNYAAFSGRIKKSFNAYIGRVKVTVDASFDSREAEVSLSAKAQFCADGHCDSVSIKELSVNGSGQIRICVNVPGAGTKCDTFN